MRTWIVPFIFVAFWMGVYLFAPEERRGAIQSRMKLMINNLLGTELLLIVLSIMDTVFFRQNWIGWLSWITLAVSIVVLGKQVLASEPPPSDDGPLRP
jgi:hypothetical protein